jgi:hypothetical protein
MKEEIIKNFLQTNYLNNLLHLFADYEEEERDGLIMAEILGAIFTHLIVIKKRSNETAEAILAGAKDAINQFEKEMKCETYIRNFHKRKKDEKSYTS